MPSLRELNLQGVCEYGDCCSVVSSDFALAVENKIEMLPERLDGLKVSETVIQPNI